MTILVAIGIWLVATAIAVPQLLYFQTMHPSELVEGNLLTKMFNENDLN